MTSAPPPPAGTKISQRLLPFQLWPLSMQVIFALAMALLPLGALAIVAAMDNYSNVRASQAELMASRLTAMERTIQARLDEDFALLRAQVFSDTSTPELRANCDRRLSGLANLDPQLTAIMRTDANGRLICVSAGAALSSFNTSSLPWQAPPSLGRLPRAVVIDETSPSRDIVLAIRDLSSGDVVLGRIARPAMHTLVRAEDLDPEDHVRLLRYGETIASWGKPFRGGVPDLDSRGNIEPRQFETSKGEYWLYGVKDLPIQGFRVLVMRRASQITIPQALTVALPILMWIAAVVTGWFAIRGLVVQPLAHMRRALDRYAAGDTAIRLGGYNFQTQEVRELGDAFDRMANQISDHEEDLRSALVTQKKLTREVHHRVKNNLQIVSSLLSLQSRDASSPDVAYAYATIQKRVNALALVHRWLYDDEAMRGVDLRSLGQDLCAGLEQSVTSSEGASISIVADIERIYVGQDTAVPLAFLITELVTAAARLADGSAVSVRVGARSTGNRASLSVEAPSFRAEDVFIMGSTDPSARIVQGMARQMRTKLAHDAERGAYSIDFPVGGPASH